jgi:hypothetical protein
MHRGGQEAKTTRTSATPIPKSSIKHQSLAPWLQTSCILVVDFGITALMLDYAFPDSSDFCLSKQTLYVMDGLFPFCAAVVIKNAIDMVFAV